MYPDVFYGVIGIFIIVATTLILLLLFVNKVSKNLNTLPLVHDTGFAGSAIPI